MARLRHGLQPLPRPDADRNRRDRQGPGPRRGEAHGLLRVVGGPAKARDRPGPPAEDRLPRLYHGHERDPAPPPMVGKHREHWAHPRRRPPGAPDGCRRGDRQPPLGRGDRARIPARAQRRAAGPGQAAHRLAPDHRDRRPGSARSAADRAAERQVRRLQRGQPDLQPEPGGGAARLEPGRPGRPAPLRLEGPPRPRDRRQLRARVRQPPRLRGAADWGCHSQGRGGPDPAACVIRADRERHRPRCAHRAGAAEAAAVAPPRLACRPARAPRIATQDPRRQSVTNHKVGTQEQWQAAREELLAEEKELTRRSDELARKRRELPWVPVEKQYSFETEAATKSLAELFDGRSQLLIYHFMFGPAYEAGCTVCSSITDTIAPNAVHLAARDVTMLLVSRAPLERLLAYRERMGWDIGWVSTAGNDFNRDLGFTYTEEELRPFLEGEIPPMVKEMAERSGTDVAGYVTEGPGLSAHTLSDGAVYRTYVTPARGLEPAMGYYNLLDRAPMGRNEEDPAGPFWLRRHDEY